MPAEAVCRLLVRRSGEEPFRDSAVPGFFCCDELCPVIGSERLAAPAVPRVARCYWIMEMGWWGEENPLAEEEVLSNDVNAFS